jgi:transposase
LTARLKAAARRDEAAKRLMTIPGFGPICAMALTTLEPPNESLEKGRDFSAWAGLTPKQHSTGGKVRLGNDLPPL